MKALLKGPFVALSTALVSNMACALPVFINEFHYDNQGGDQNEFVEIAGQDGTRLDGWMLEFYNGGNGRRYMSWDLSGTLTDTDTGVGVLAFTGRGIQNGSQDGIALVDAAGELVQFLSYEGVLSATDGAASGQSSVDVGVFESPSTPIGTSIQLQGTGFLSTDFTWGLGIASQGLSNVAQGFSVPLSEPPEQANPGAEMPPTGSGVAAVSEPAGLSLLGLGLLALGASRHRRQI